MLVAVAPLLIAILMSVSQWLEDLGQLIKIIDQRWLLPLRLQWCCLFDLESDLIEIMNVVCNVFITSYNTVISKNTVQKDLRVLRLSVKC